MVLYSLDGFLEWGLVVGLDFLDLGSVVQRFQCYHWLGKQPEHFFCNCLMETLVGFLVDLVADFGCFGGSCVFIVLQLMHPFVLWIKSSIFPWE
jgi:hypothetical protein